MLSVNAMSGFGARTGFTATTDSTSAMWEGATSDFTFTGNNLDHNNQNNSSVRMVDSFDSAGDFSITATITSGALNVLNFGVYDIAENSTFNSAINHGQLRAMTKSWSMRMGVSTAYVNYGSADQSDNFTIANGSVIIIKRVGATFSILEDGATQHTWSQTDTVTVKCILGSSDSSNDWNDVSITA